MIIHLISSPRTISTALMYSFAQRTDMAVIDEPFYGYYLALTGLDHPGRDETMALLPTDLDGVQHWIREKSSTRPHLFLKNIGSHAGVLDPAFAKEYHNVILTRNPERIVTSFSKVISHPTHQDIGLKSQFELLTYYRENGKYPPIVLDSEEVLQDPRGQLKKLCEALSLEFEEKMLSWEEGAKPYDGPWAKYWYKSVHKSTGFSPARLSNDPVPSHLTQLASEAMDYYKKLSLHTLK